MSASSIIAVVGGSCAGKTSYAYHLAKSLNATGVICGDKYQLIRGWPLATGQREASLQMGVQKYLYQCLPPDSEPFTAEQYARAVRGIVAAYPGLYIIDGLSASYQSAIDNFGAPVSLYGLAPRPIALAVPIWVWRMVHNWGVINEVRWNFVKYGRSSWITKNSLVVRHISDYLDGFTSLAGLAIGLIRAGLHDEGGVIHGKHAAFLANARVRWVR